LGIFSYIFTYKDGFLNYYICKYSLGVLFMLGVDNLFDMLNKSVFRPYFRVIYNLLNPIPGLDDYF